MSSSSRIQRTLSPRRSKRLPSGALPDVSAGDGPEGTQQTAGNAGPSRRRGFRRQRSHPDTGLPDPESDEQFEKEWGRTKAQEEQLLKQFQETLRGKGALNDYTADKYVLRRFLRARQHSIPKATEMMLAHLQWRKEIGADTIQKDFHFHERDAFIAMYPQGYHRTDKIGRPIYIQHIGQINLKQIYEVTTEERMIKFHVQEYERCRTQIMPACSKVAGRHIDQTFAILDLKGVGMKHITGEVKKMMSKVMAIDQNNYPEMLGHTCIINAPSVFQFIWRFVRPMLDPRTQGKIEVCPSNFTPALLQWVDPECLPEYLGGTSKATLLDDKGPWNEVEEPAELDSRMLSIGVKEAPKEGAQNEEAITATIPAITTTTRGSAPAPPVSPFAVAAPAADRETTAGESAGFADANSIQRVSSAYYSDTDEAYYSPRSAASASSFASQRDRLRDADAALEAAAARLDGDMAGTVPGQHQAGASLAAGERGAMEPAGPSGRAAEGLEHTGSMGGVPLIARVRALEERLPQQQARLAEHLSLRARVAPAGDANLLTRVETLESAMHALLQAQTVELDRRQTVPEKQPGCCGCCSVM